MTRFDESNSSRPASLQVPQVNAGEQSTVPRAEALPSPEPCKKGGGHYWVVGRVTYYLS